MSSGKEVEQLLKSFAALGLEEMDDVRLMNRRDIKYVFPIQRLPLLLRDLSASHKVLEVNHHRAQTYETVYYDTEDLQMYMMHHRGEYDRHKIRIRKYRDTEKSFLEVKVKDNRGITEKSRVEWTSKKKYILSDEEEFLHTHTPYDEKELLPVLSNEFRRITLVSSEQKERITIDFDLRLKLLETGRSEVFPGLVIVEIKGGDQRVSQDMIGLFRKHRIKPMRFSKYCLGVAKLNREVDSHRFRSRIRAIDRIELQAAEEGENEKKLQSNH